MFRSCLTKFTLLSVGTSRHPIYLRNRPGPWSTRLMENGEKILDSVSVLYRSENYLVVDKHYDVLINSDDPEQLLTVENQLRKSYPELVDNSVKHGFRFQHRLDLATSGVLCLSLNKPASAKFFKLLQKRQMTKHYLALVRGHVPADQASGIQHIETPIGRDNSITDFCKMCTTSNPNCDKPLPAHTGLVLLQHGTYDNLPVSKVLLIPYTGRTHQLRVHCQSHGHLIVGDYTYSDRADTKPYRMMLHAYHLIAPIPGEQLNVIAPDPLVDSVDKLWKPERTFVTYDEFVRSNQEGVKLAATERQSSSLLDDINTETKSS